MHFFNSCRTIWEYTIKIQGLEFLNHFDIATTAIIFPCSLTSLDAISLSILDLLTRLDKLTSHIQEDRKIKRELTCLKFNPYFISNVRGDITSQWEPASARENVHVLNLRSRIRAVTAVISKDERELDLYPDLPTIMNLEERIWILTIPSSCFDGFR